MCFALILLAVAAATVPDEYFDAPSGYKLAVRRWRAHPPTLATLVLQHGGGWHSGYFGQVGEELSSVGFEVVALDAMGHGYSEGPGGTTRWTTLQDVRRDLAAFVAMQPRPVVLLGESMGAVIVAPLNVDALVFCGGLFKVPVRRPVVVLLRVIAWLRPAARFRVKSLNRTFDSAFGDPKWAAAARRDPHIVVDAFYAKSLVDVVNELPHVRKHAKLITVPALVVHSTADTRTDVHAATRFFDDLASDDKKLVLYDDASHQLFQDTPANIHRAIADLRTWLVAHFPPPPDEAAPSCEDEES